MTSLIDGKTGESILNDLEVADTFWKRFIGLQFRSVLPRGTGILLSPCSSIHTCFMRFPIDIIMLDRNDIIIDIRRNVRPWRAVLCSRGTVKLIETNVDEVNAIVGTPLHVNASKY